MDRGPGPLSQTGGDMTKIKFCGLTRPCDIEAANELRPDYVGFVFAKKSRRYLTQEKALELRRMLDPAITTVGVFVNEAPECVAGLLEQGIIGIAQLHGAEDEAYMQALRRLTDRPVIQAFRIDCREDVERAVNSSADYILLDSGSGGTGTVFNWELIQDIRRPFFLAGGLNLDNVEMAVRRLHPFGVDVSSGIETEGMKDHAKMSEFAALVRKIDFSSYEHEI